MACTIDIHASVVALGLPIMAALFALILVLLSQRQDRNHPEALLSVRRRAGRERQA
jgi:hypothetical protein